jgi:tRNA(fMet)-specific endonuclease VapC
MKYLVDTDWVAEYLKGRDPAVRTLDAMAPEDLAVSLITYGEIYEGIYYGRDPKRAEQGFLQFLRGIDVIPVNKAMMKEFAQMRGQLRKSGQIIGDLDLLIAATAIYHDVPLITHNLRHFSRIPTLNLYQIT